MCRDPSMLRVASKEYSEWACWSTQPRKLHYVKRMPPLSVLDLAPIPEGKTPADALRNTLDLAQHAERWGIGASGWPSITTWSGSPARRRRWSSAMLRAAPEHDPRRRRRHHAAEPLAAGHRRAVRHARDAVPGPDRPRPRPRPGTDQLTLPPLRRDPSAADTFPQDVLELQRLLGPVQPGQKVQAVPGAGTNVPLWILGSSLFGAQLAAMLGLPYAFASHFAPDALMQALHIYREKFQPSAQLIGPTRWSA